MLTVLEGLKKVAHENISMKEGRKDMHEMYVE